jgi:ATP-binding cassette subfamily F protein 3
MKLEFEREAGDGKNVLWAEGLSIGYAADHPLLSRLSFQVRSGRHIALTGPNGSGKTTLLRTLAGKLHPLAGELKLGAACKTGYITQEQVLLDPNLSALWTIRSVARFNETEARNFLHYFLFKGDDALKPTGELSFGERARLQLGLLIAGGCTLLLLDEPINHLDIPSRERFEAALEKFNGTVLAAVHDRYFIERFASQIWTIRDGKLIPS